MDRRRLRSGSLLNYPLVQITLLTLIALIVAYPIYERTYISKWSTSSPASYIVIGEDTDGDGFADTIYVRDGYTGRIREFQDLDSALAYASSSGGLVFIRRGNYTLHSTFPTTNLTGRVKLKGEAGATVIYSSGSFDAINISLVPVEDLVFQRADGSFADASFDPNVFGEILRDNTVDREITYWKAVEGRSFVISYRFEDVASGGNATVVVVNPSGSGIRITIEAIVITVTDQGRVDIMTDVAFDNYAGNLTARNRNLGMAVSSQIIAHYGAHLTSLGTPYMYGVLPGGSGKYASGDTMSYAVCILDEGHNLCIVVENTSTSSSDIAIVVFYFEDEK